MPVWFIRQWGFFSLVREGAGATRKATSRASASERGSCQVPEGPVMAGMYMPGLPALTHGVEGATRARIAAWYTAWGETIF
jgi:hypothetical protein